MSFLQFGKWRTILHYPKLWRIYSTCFLVLEKRIIKHVIKPCQQCFQFHFPHFTSLAPIFSFLFNGCVRFFLRPQSLAFSLLGISSFFSGCYIRFFLGCHRQTLVIIPELLFSHCSLVFLWPISLAFFSTTLCELFFAYHPKLSLQPPCILGFLFGHHPWYFLQSLFFGFLFSQ